MAAETVLRQLETPGLDGLSAPEAERRLLRHGPNLVPRPRPRSALSIFLEQLTSLPVLLLGASAVVSIATGGLGDAVVILAAVLANASIATATEEQAERTILAMDDVAVPPAPVRRDGRPAMIPAEALVPGDIVPVAPGMLVPADLRRLLAADLTVNESALTGESLPVAKSASAALR
jgi:Ca2+-transporting ATPase